MRTRKIVLALCACLALGAFAANAAQAAEGWTIGTTENQGFEGTLIASGTHERISCKRHGTSSLLFTSTLLGIEVELSAEGVDCLEKAGSANAATIDNTTSKGHSEGILTFTGVKVLKPSTKCTVGNVGKASSGEITTEALTDQVIMDPTSGSTTVFDKFSPEVAGGALTTIEFGGAECPLGEASAPVKGTACGESVHTNAGGTGYERNLTGTLTKVQSLLFGAAQQTTGGCALTLGTKAAQLAGAVDTELSGTNAGKPFGAIGGAAEAQHVTLIPIRAGGGGACTISAGGRVEFTVLHETCEYELKNNNLVEPIQVTKVEIGQEKQCLGFITNCIESVAVAEKCEAPGVIFAGTVLKAAGGVCFVKLEYASAPATKPALSSLEIETKSLPGGAIVHSIVGQVIN